MSENKQTETFDSELARHAQDEYCERNGLPHFAPYDGHCYRCHGDIYSVISVENAGSVLITGCPCCHVSYCD